MSKKNVYYQFTYNTCSLLKFAAAKEFLLMSDQKQGNGSSLSLKERRNCVCVCVCVQDDSQTRQEKHLAETELDSD